ncbi:MAG: 1-acyl-sn-glycerol-3-phosphate acyltransferase [Clostridia bacterium]|nr:1-acyl-sn-glycerol-3-phosphate acyltransferase [Clostridia bacterium]
MFDPRTNHFPYPERTDAHYLHVKKNDGTVFDRDYPFIDTSFGARFKIFCVRILLYLVVYPVTCIRFGLRVRGRKNLKKHREELRKGVISCSNHVLMWDYLAIRRAIIPFKPSVLIWAPNIRGENGKMMRTVGGIPIPEEGENGFTTMVSTVSEYVRNGGWLHIYPEGSMWEYYMPIRPFKDGVAAFSCMTGRPVLPLGFSYREPGWIRRVIFRQCARITLSIGEPIWPDPELSPAERHLDLTRRAHEAVCRLAGIDPKENLYPPVFDGTNTRVDYYTNEYGIGYKGSH